MFPFAKLSIELQGIKLKRPEFDLKRGLVKPPILNWLPVAVEGNTIIPQVKEVAPVDGVEVVGWMQEAAAYNAVFDSMCDEYSRLGSYLISRVGDGLIPSVGVGSGDRRVMFTSVTATTVAGQGGAYVVAKDRRFFCPEYGKATIAIEDVLAWAAIPGRYAIQWTAALLDWAELAGLPVTDRVRFGACGGLIAPNFFSCATRVPAPMGTYRIGLTSDKPQTVAIKGRDTKGAFQDVLFEDSFDIEAGESEVIYNVFGIPFSPSFTMELQPADGTETILDYIEVFP